MPDDPKNQRGNHAASDPVGLPNAAKKSTQDTESELPYDKNFEKKLKQLLSHYWKRIALILGSLGLLAGWIITAMDLRIPTKSDRLEQLLDRAEAFEASKDIAELAVFKNQLSEYSTRLSDLIEISPQSLDSKKLASELRAIECTIENLDTLIDSAAEFENKRLFDRITSRAETMRIAYRILLVYFNIFSAFKEGRFTSAKILQDADLQINSLVTNENAASKLKELTIQGDVRIPTYVNFIRGSILIRLIEQTNEFDTRQERTCNEAIRFLTEASSEFPPFEKATSNLSVAYIFKYRNKIRPLFFGQPISESDRQEATDIMSKALDTLDVTPYTLDPATDPIGLSIRFSNYAEALALQAIVLSSPDLANANLDRAKAIIDTLEKWPKYHPVIHVALAQIQGIEVLLKAKSLKDDEKLVFAQNAISQIGKARDMNYQWRFRDVEHLINCYPEFHSLNVGNFVSDLRGAFNSKSADYPMPLY
jgi:hypothetical protein